MCRANPDLKYYWLREGKPSASINQTFDPSKTNPIFTTESNPFYIFSAE